MNSRELSRLFGENVQFRRKKMGLTQEELAERIGIGQQSLSRMERGGIAPKFERLQDFAAVLNCSVAELFRPRSETDDAPEAALADMLHGLVPYEKEVIVRFVRDLASVFRKNRYQ